MNIKVVTCSKCHKSFTIYSSTGVCPYCQHVYVDYADVVVKGMKILSKFLNKKYGK